MRERERERVFFFVVVCALRWVTVFVQISKNITDLMKHAPRLAMPRVVLITPAVRPARDRHVKFLPDHRNR
jgi:hypothetical protein